MHLAKLATAVVPLTLMATLGVVDVSANASPGPAPARPAAAPAADTYTAFSHTTARPDRSATTQLSLLPTFAHDRGAWRAVDNSVTGSTDPAARFVAANAFRPVQFGSSAGRLVSLGFEGGPVTFSTTDLALSSPQLDGQDVVYPHVAPGADLRFQVDGSGLRSLVTLNSAAAPTQYRFHLSDPLHQLGRLSALPDGGYQFSSVTGEGVHVQLSPARAWAVDKAHPDAAPGSSRDSATITATPAGNGFDIVEGVNPSWLSHQTFPVVLDPAITYQGSGTRQTHIVNNEDANLNFCCGAYDEVGYGSGYNTSGAIRRTLISFDTSTVPSNAHVTSANLRLDETTNGQGQTSNVQAFLNSHSWTEGATWNKYDGTNAWPTAGGSPSGSALSSVNVSPTLGYYTWPVTSAVQGWVNTGTSHVTNNGFLVKFSTETQLSVLRFGSYRDVSSHYPQLVIDYNQVPNVPSNLQPPASTTNATLTPTLSATGSDPDGTSVRLDFQVFVYGGGPLVASGSASNVPNNGTGSFTVPSGALRGGQHYGWHVRAYDGTDYSAYSPWSDFTVSSSACRDATVTSQAADAYGGTTATLTRDGLTFTQRVPAASWRPLLAPNDQLSYYGFPVRPTDSAALAAWNQRYQGYTGAVAAGICSLDAFTAGTEQYPYYSGVESYAAQTPSGAPFVGSSATFTAPAVSSGATCSDNNEVTSWVGIQDNAGDRLIQAGTFESDNNPNDGHAFWEYIAPNGKAISVQEFDGFTINAGDNVSAMVSYDPSSANANFSVYDQTTGQSDETTVHNDADFYGGDRGQFITERPSENGVPQALMPFTEQSWGSAQLNQDPQHYTSYTDVGQLNPYVADMYQQSGTTAGTLLANIPNDAMDSSSDFRVDWDNCGYQGK